MDSKDQQAENLANILGVYRKAQGITKSQFARKSGISPSFISRLENKESKRGISFETAVKLSKAMNCKTDQLAHFMGIF